MREVPMSRGEAAGRCSRGPRHDRPPCAGALQAPHAAEPHDLSCSRPAPLRDGLRARTLGAWETGSCFRARGSGQLRLGHAARSAAGNQHRCGTLPGCRAGALLIVMTHSNRWAPSCSRGDRDTESQTGLCSPPLPRDPRRLPPRPRSTGCNRCRQAPRSVPSELMSTV